MAYTTITWKPDNPKNRKTIECSDIAEAIRYAEGALRAGLVVRTEGYGFYQTPIILVDGVIKDWPQPNESEGV